jgi:[ribosomal protein S5]-alanine N-acetyltransferase
MLTELETERLVLRELDLADAPALQAFQNCPTQWRHQAVEPAELADSKARIDNYLKYRGSGVERRLFVYLARRKQDGAVIGTVSLGRSHPAIASLGLGVAAVHGGRGFGTEMARRLLAFGFMELALHRVAADVAVENRACIRVLEKIGMQREGVMRDCIFAQGRWWTEAKYALLKSDAAVGTNDFSRASARAS